jgi:hypothetical protein
MMNDHSENHSVRICISRQAVLDWRGMIESLAPLPLSIFDGLMIDEIGGYDSVRIVPSIRDIAQETESATDFSESYAVVGKAKSVHDPAVYWLSTTRPRDLAADKKLDNLTLCLDYRNVLLAEP